MRIAFFLAAFLTAVLAQAGEEKIQLKPGPGREQVALRCATCHSLDYLAMNSRFLDRKGWETVVNKMVKAMGAPIPPDEIPVIVEYLTQSYGRTESVPQKPASQ